ncbi:hypothetical protein WH240_13295 [Gluconobacter wancherniae]|uniref:hypothetical protein n=1 Tax=Gluconobacter wancherniae TaxID=1307955 RepID=UPI0030AB4112
MASIADLHNIVPVIPQIMSDPQYVFISPLTPKEDASWLSWLKAIGPIILSAITTFVAVGQFRLSRAQHALSQQQVGIAVSQKDIAEDKHRLELFEKRFETYELFLDMALKCHKLSPDRRPHEDSTKTTNEREKNAGYMKFVRDNESKMISLGEGSIFLFGSEVKSILDDARHEILSKAELVKSLNEIRRTDIDTTNFISEFSGKREEEKGYQEGIISCDTFLKEFYEKKLPEITGPYLKMTPYLAKD